jgi:endonuclease/exonuclease/phosphatase family metal-dependent hydrolase
VDDDGKEGGVRRGTAFVILGNLGVDPVKGEKFREPITTSLGATRMINFDFVPSAAAGGSTDTCAAGLRLDYVLPSKTITVVGGGIQRWPDKGPSDHYPVWLDIAVAAP